MSVDIITVPPPGDPGELNLLIAAPVLGYVEKHYGRDALRELANDTGISEDLLLKPRGWVLHAELEAVFAHVRKKLGSDGKFLEACSFEMVKSYGPLALVFRAGTVLLSYRVIAATIQFVSRVSTYTLVKSTHNSVTLQYKSRRPESRLMCLSRQAQLPTVPLMFWNLPPARLREPKCIARGDDCCEYSLQWSESLSWRWPLFGLGFGFALLFALRHFGVEHAWALPVIGALCGSTFAFRHMVKQALDFHTETTNRVGELVREHESAVEQMIDLHSRQEAFNALMAERIEARTTTLEAMITELSSSRARSEVALLGVSHDMRNPLQVAMINAQVLNDDPDAEIAAVGNIIFDNIVRVEAQMKRLLAIASAQDNAFALNNRRVDVAPLVERVRKNLQALVIARDIRVSVFRTREAPDAIETDIMLFDRVVDNLISNAVKYTERGSIIVEVGGSPGHLSLKISDTGRGISPERLEKVFVGGTRDAKPLLGESHGIGLANTIRLLDELGGRLEVMSKPDVGTTIWAHMPVEAPKRDSGILRSVDAGEVLRRVVTIRSAANQ